MNGQEKTVSTNTSIEKQLYEEADKLLKQFLEKFPNLLRSAAIAFDYNMQNPTNMPAGVFRPAVKLNTASEYLRVCQSLDRINFGIRAEADRAVASQEKQISEASTKLIALKDELEKKYGSIINETKSVDNEQQQ